MNKSSTMRKMYGPLIPQMKTHEGGRYPTHKIGDVVTRAPVPKVPPLKQSMKPQ